MKKGFISALFISLMIAVPAIAYAEENEKSLLPLELTNVVTETVQELESPIVESNIDTAVQAAAALVAPVENDGQSKTEKSGLLSISLSLPVVGEVKVDLLAGEKAESESENKTLSQKRLLGVEIKNSELLGDVNLEVLKRNEQGERNASSSGLVSLDVDNGLLGKTHVGVLEGNKSGSSDQANISANLIVVESNDSLLGNKRVGVGEYTNNNGQQKVDLADVRDVEPSKVISNPDTNFNKTADQKQMAEQNIETLNEDIEGSDLIVGNSNIENEDTVLGKNVLAAAEMPGVRNSTVLNQQRENELDEYKNILNQVNESETNTIKLVASSGIAPSNGSSGASSGSSTANSSGGVTGLAAYLAVDYFKEIETSCQISDGADKLSDQWQNTPPGDPPKAPFFLIA